MSYNPLDRLALTNVVRELKRPKTFFRSLAFSGRDRMLPGNKAEIMIKTDQRRLAPITKDMEKGKLVERIEFNTKLVKTPYSKQKMVCSACDLFERNFGETLYPADDAARRDIEMMIVEDLRTMDDGLMRLEEWMCAQVLDGGVLTLEDGQEVDYGLPASHNITLTGANLWDDPASDPLALLRKWKRIIAKDSGLGRVIVVMGESAYDEFLKNDNVQEQLDNLRFFLGSVDPIEIGGATRVAVLKDPAVELWTYDEYYIDPVSGVERTMMPENKVFMFSKDMNNQFVYGRIAHCGGPGRANRWAHSWLDDDSGLHWMSVESSPLAIMSQPNAHLVAEVLS